jgi:hypothetical protein
VNLHLELMYVRVDHSLCEVRPQRCGEMSWDAVERLTKHAVQLDRYVRPAAMTGTTAPVHLLSTLLGAESGLAAEWRQLLQAMFVLLLRRTP